ncbi:ferredoxin thioredoxin reductase beta chain [Chloroherpeton thalassium ATCC 35110]|uniref:ferredoxin:thioredoxin reductase n=1 Tax=Chloroherpeton thalassium (strain ATCC 35110 / GB-78) TaxID=517418 RepID=B3QYM4_CHLT3|nr:ferredoxin-thioredoxin reductase catalytic domain-containing protein [Chloroherpeton thalassium]ACF13652.1 ferredoxin thioredoxin reductase beta chain [Chloroherpeton thalassium ATCC 35110]
MPQPSEKSIQKIRKFIEHYCEKAGMQTHEDSSITDSIVVGLAANLEELGRPLCPCRFYPDKKEELKHRTWVCACDDMQIYKYCHCMLFVTPEGLPVTEYLPEDHEGRKTYGLIKDPTPDKGRSLRAHAEAREKERQERHS